MPSPILSTVYASAPAGQVIIYTLDIRVAGMDPILICNGFEDVTATLETSEEVTFEAGNLSVALPKRDDSGQQTLRFGLWNVNGRAQEVVSAALESGEEVPILYREFLASDLSVPAAGPVQFVMLGGQFEGLELQTEGGYYDILNQAYPRERYTQLNAPGIRYL
ncbi:hypothetical protein A6D6_02700 [Alcanivorax xiamenensis]|uniref:DUF1833 domain-containing protein n=1 Tax=Alcanivorax xiamenensis TaxID=1177156 RepID=A0ABQ6Y6N9_9GAMM|nr:DUF1833 family protein [Alcanivorax xiamenensis]KAF0804936.1 hypothetical protein A6D6_02700 [Alcanivorax xiamenensis]